MRMHLSPAAAGRGIVPEQLSILAGGDQGFAVRQQHPAAGIGIVAHGKCLRLSVVRHLRDEPVRTGSIRPAAIRGERKAEHSGGQLLFIGARRIHRSKYRMTTPILARDGTSARTEYEIQPGSLTEGGPAVRLESFILQITTMSFSKLINHAGQNLEFAFHESPAPRDPRHLVLIGHGVTANMNRPFLKALAEALATGGFHALRWSWSGNGGSEGDFRDSCISREAAELGAIIDQAASAGYTVSYAGHSMGGAVGVVTAAEDARLRHLICLAPMVQTVRFSEAEFGTMTPDAGCMWDDPACPLSSTFVNDLRNMGSILTAAEKLPLPVLIIHGQEDDLVPVSEAEALYHAVLHEHPVSLVRLLTDHVFSGEATSAMCHEVVEWLTAQTD